MTEHATPQQNGPERREPAHEAAPESGAVSVGLGGADSLLHMQRVAGNRAVLRMLSDAGAPPASRRPSSEPESPRPRGVGLKTARRAPANQIRRMLQTRNQVVTAVGAPKADVSIGGRVLKKMSTKYKAVLSALDAYHDYVATTKVNQALIGEQVREIHDLLDTVVDACAKYIAGDHEHEEERHQWISDLLNKATLEKRVVKDLGKQAAALDGRYWKDAIPGLGSESGGLVVPPTQDVEEQPDPGLEGKAAKAGKLFADFNASVGVSSLAKPAGTIVKNDRLIIHQTKDKAVVFVEKYSTEKDAEGDDKLGTFNVVGSGYTQAGNVKLGDSVHVAVGNDVPIFTREPSADDVNQGAIGDCYLVAALASIARTNPALIYNMIKDNGDGTVTVKLFKPKDAALVATYLKITKSVVTGDRHSSGALWVALLEKAYATVGLAVPKGKALLAPASKSYAKIGDGGQSDTAFMILTGHQPPTQTDVRSTKLAANPLWGANEQNQFKRGEFVKMRSYALLNQSDALTAKWIEFAKVHAKALDKFRTIEQFEEFFTANGLDPEIATAFNAPLRKEVPAKRGSGSYSDYQEELYVKIGDALGRGEYVAAGTKEEVETETGGKKTKGHSGGEETAEGVVGSHAYSILAVREVMGTAGKARKFIRLRNPWGKGADPTAVSRVYKGGLEGDLEIETDPKKLKKLAKPEFDLELTDFTKHFNKIYWS